MYDFHNQSQEKDNTTFKQIPLSTSHHLASFFHSCFGWVLVLSRVGFFLLLLSSENKSFFELQFLHITNLPNSSAYSLRLKQLLKLNSYRS